MTDNIELNSRPLDVYVSSSLNWIRIGSVFYDDIYIWYQVEICSNLYYTSGHVHKNSKHNYKTIYKKKKKLFYTVKQFIKYYRI